MKQEYDEIHEAGIVLQVDCPDLAMSAPDAIRRRSLEEFRDARA